MSKYYRVLTHSSQSGYTRERNIIVNAPASGSFADYLLLKEIYKKLDKTRNWRYKVFFSISFLRGERAKGGLKCVYCGKEHLQIATPTSPVSKHIMATVDHFNPISKDGDEYNHDNMLVACNKCNQKKTNDIWDISTLKYISEEKLKNLLKYLEDKNILSIFVKN